MAENENMEMKLDGIPALMAWYRREPVEAQRAIDQAKTNTGFLVQREARRNAPYMRGDLERSITFELVEGGVRIFVPTNSAAGKYGYKMHNGKYNRGPGTVAKGARAGRKYITRAATDSESKINSFFKSALDSMQK